MDAWGDFLTHRGSNPIWHTIVPQDQGSKSLEGESNHFYGKGKLVKLVNMGNGVGVVFTLLLCNHAPPLFGQSPPTPGQPSVATVVIEAESFDDQTFDDVRRWHRIDATSLDELSGVDDATKAAMRTASDAAYVMVLPDTRRTHADRLIRGENFSPLPGQMAVLHYPVDFPVAGRYRVWTRAYSTGSEDNGLHVGIDGQWPPSGQRIQWCQGKHQWTWSSAQRTDANHCGEPLSIHVEVSTAGVHVIQISMREDGCRIDQIVLTTDEDYRPVDPVTDE